MKILYYSPHPQLNFTDATGYGTHMREMVEAFRKLGHTVEIVIIGGQEKIQNSVASNQEGNFLKKFLKQIVPSIVWSSLKDYQLLKRDKVSYSVLGEKVKVFNPDLIYERGFYMMTSGCEVAEKYSIPHILEINAPLEYEKKLFEGNTFFTSKAFNAEGVLMEQPQLICVVSSPIKEYFLKRHPGLRQDRILVTPNAINIDKIDVKSEIDVSLLEKIQGKLVVGFVGSIFPYHGVERLINEFCDAYRKHSNLLLMIVGDGIILNELKLQAKKLGIEGSVIFTGKVPNKMVYSYIEKMDITVLANTEWYCSPVKIFEYGIMKKAIVSLDTAAVRDVMKNEEDAILIGDKSGELRAAIEKLVESNELRQKMATSFYNKVIAKHTWTKVAESILDRLNTIKTR